MESHEGNIICRLCLKKLTKYCEPIEEIVQHTLDFLALCPNLTISDDPMICETCAVNLKKCFDFKARCLSTEDCIASFAEGEVKKVDLGDIYSKIKVDGNIDKVPDDHSMCRFCLELVRDDASTSVRHDIDLIAILQKYFREMDLRITDDIIACTPCYDSLRFHVSFVNSYLSIEGKINEYCKVEGVNYKKQVDLRDVATFISKSMLNVGSISSLTIKEEKHENIVNCNVDVHVKFEDVVDVEQEREKLVDKGIQQNNNSSQHHSSPSQSVCVPEKYKCVLCNFETKRKYYIKTHMLIHKTNSELTMYKCEKCAFETKRKVCLRRHSLTHMDKSEIEMHKCEVCPFETKWKKNLRKHILSHTDTPEVVTSSVQIMYKCDLCNFKTKHKSNLKRHMLSHKTSSEITMYKCEACAFETKYKDYLQKHMLIHKDMSKIGMYKCEVCPFQTKWNGNFQEHLLSHRNTPDIVVKNTMYKCDLCDQETKRKFDLKRHLLTHKPYTEITMHKCDVCDHETKRKSDLKKHLLTHKPHTEIAMYECDVCSFVSKYKNKFQKHKCFQCVYISDVVT